MQSPCSCCGAPLLGNPKSTTFVNAVAASHLDFATATANTIFPATQFTNHESLPSLLESFSQFNKAYPHYIISDDTDKIRQHHYSHLSLSNHVCLDYIGIGLFASSLLPFFHVCYKSATLKSQLLYGGQDSDFESAIRKRIMEFLNVSQDDYSMVFTANRTSAFKLLAESYPFHSNKRLLTVYDYESEAVESMIDNSKKRGAKIMSAEFSWPNMRIQSAKLKKMVVNKRKNKDRGLFVFPLQSRMTGTRYSYLWMSVAKANGWHVVLDACALGPKDMDTLGLSLIQPDFLISSFFNVFGGNPSGFGCLFVKKTGAKALESSTMAKSIGIVSLVRHKKMM